MSSCDGLSNSSGSSLTCSPITDRLQDNGASPSLAIFAATDLPSSSQNDVMNVSTTALYLERYASELLLWLQHSTTVVPIDDALFFFETRHPELLDDLPLLFAWLSLFLAQHEAASNVKMTDMAQRALLQLEKSGDLAVIAEKFGLKSTLTLLFWRHENGRQELNEQNEQRTDECVAGETGSSRSRNSFQDVDGLLQWVLSHRNMQLTKQDIIDYVVERYPIFAAAKTTAALKVWTSRFIKKHIPSQPFLATMPPAGPSHQIVISDVETHDNAATLPSEEMVTPQLLPQPKSLDDKVVNPETRVDASLANHHTGKRRSCSGRYMLFSNEFKLHAITMLEEGKSVAQVTEELGLKSSNCLHYWKSIRDKLITSEKKRFRLAGGGRRSSCAFENELLSWVSERHQQGQGTDVKAVLEYMKRSHSYFTDGKKEPTLRKWILRFFKRCWRIPSTSIDSRDAEKSYIFV
ncbi:uncharacterized protein PHALS_10197 [Plasmopara halstedii]|uniref:Uncharacterized protein n=1 Tax=Plasmopara halstedii TaxID=4781 RepID=A0A0P1AH39_PLAHL|nr:uncharacterized protein PHALS_10197 [Plasmopara halstedii]CEG39973.1 hypothetical protein PHALS_10197 [Plasmopara halstedii]|eukprot:XP_024576342.1 hypothetical protein PHALS_10197 [Plasmopara halstedii]